MNTLTKFLSERPAINLREFCKEADISYSLASKIRVGVQKETQETRYRMRKAMAKYGYVEEDKALGEIFEDIEKQLETLERYFP